MSSSCLKLLLALTLFVIITECRPQGPGERPRKAKARKACKTGGDCRLGFSCLLTWKGNKRVHRCRKGTYNSKIFCKIFLVPEWSLGLKLSDEAYIILF